MCFPLGGFAQILVLRAVARVPGPFRTLWPWRQLAGITHLVGVVRTNRDVAGAPGESAFWVARSTRHTGVIWLRPMRYGGPSGWTK